MFKNVGESLDVFCSMQFLVVVGRKQGHNLRYILAVYNFVKKIKNIKNPCTGRDITPLDICHSTLSIGRPVRQDIFLLKPRLFWARGYNQRHFGPFCTRIYIISTEFQDIKSSKKDENMMSCTRLYVHDIIFSSILLLFIS